MGEAKWASVADGARVLTDLRRKVERLPDAVADLRFAVVARESVREPGDATVVTAREVFAER